MKNNSSGGWKVFYGIALAIMLFGMFNFGTYVFYENPDYQTYCGDYNSRPVYNDKITCEANDGKWTDNNYGVAPKPVDAPIGYCDQDFTCRQEYEEAQKAHNDTVFYIYVIAGLIAAVIGLFIASSTFQITGFGAGVAFIIEGILRNLNNKIPAFIAGAVAFLIIAFFIWKKTRD